MTGQVRSVVFLPQIMKDLETNISVPCGSVDNRTVGMQKGQEIGMKNIQFNLPSILLTNLQSFGKPGKSDKSTELELVL